MHTLSRDTQDSVPQDALVSKKRKEKKLGKYALEAAPISSTWVFDALTTV